MNNYSATGRLTRDPDIRVGTNQRTAARFTIAVDRDYKVEGQPSADFIPCAAFGKTADFIEKYFRKGMKIELTGRLASGSYTDRSGAKVYTLEVIADRVGFAEKKSEAPVETPAEVPEESGGFESIPDNIGADLPFH